jgi:membrane fusion protein (multidrug efflux system)
MPKFRPPWGVNPSLLGLTWGIAALFMLAGCGRSDSESTAAGAPGTADSSSARPPTAERDRPAEPAIPVAVQQAFTGAIASYYNATASLEAEKEAEILARVSGVIQSLACEEGDYAPRGQELLRIENDEYLWRLKQAEALTANLRARFDRLEAMLGEGLVTEEEYQAAKSDLANTEAEEALARLTLSYTTVTAPFTGRIVQRLVDVGQNVSAGTSLFVLADFDPLLAKVFVPSKEFKKLEPDQPVLLLLNGSQERLEGRIKLISPIIDPSSGTIKITVEISSYPPQTRPGDFADVQIVTERRNATTLVPKIAVVMDKGENVVYVAKEGTAERRIVTLGFVDNDNAEILEGVQAGETVVVKGQRSLKHGSPLKILEEPSGAAAPDAPKSQGEESDA